MSSPAIALTGPLPCRRRSRSHWLIGTSIRGHRSTVRGRDAGSHCHARCAGALCRRRLSGRHRRRHLSGRGAGRGEGCEAEGGRRAATLAEHLDWCRLSIGTHGTLQA